MGRATKSGRNGVQQVSKEPSTYFVKLLRKFTSTTATDWLIRTSSSPTATNRHCFKQTLRAPVSSNEFNCRNVKYNLSGARNSCCLVVGLSAFKQRLLTISRQRILFVLSLLRRFEAVQVCMHDFRLVGHTFIANDSY